MTDYLISRLNTCISEIDSDSIQKHINKGDLDDWIQEWRIEAASLSFGLFSQIDCLKREIFRIQTGKIL